ncbi:MAG: type IV pili twitching motility protein PilT [Lentisphaerae bacterium RIFOXYB12_FULL_65_16]|nr:MAG: type IV pili twitching motility protein PilT [Lentisphaerae bacterium RIFOXYA12_64_32]OGV92720.1 MAG: type IV pili twitching motility protein PilT [Lentisphaerae bacterium RIFOXYB12_FULL_65_16]
MDELLLHMLKMKGSDLHLKVGQPPKTRVHGELKPMPDRPPVTAEVMEEIMKGICPPVQWERYLQTHDLDFAYEIAGAARFRSNYLYDNHGMAAVFRQIPSKILSLEDLKAPEVLRRISRLKEGLVFVTGPTGSGKSTTMAAMIDYINKNFEKKIITIEDPVEFVHKNNKCIIQHREVGDHTQSFAAALHSAMKAAPDIVLLGEMRELETIRLALNCATMGMLVFGTLHTNCAPKTIDRVIDVFPADQQSQIRTMLGDCLAAIVSQLLCRTADGKGRVAAHEILLRVEGLSNVIREGQISSIRSMIESGGNDGMCSMDGTLLRLLREGRITAHEAYMKATEKENFAQLLPKDEAQGAAHA